MDVKLSERKFMAKAAWGKGKREVFALKFEILGHLRAGKNLNWIFEELSSKAQLSLGARTFRRHAAAMRREAEANGELDLSAPPPVSRPAPQPVNGTTASPATSGPASGVRRLKERVAGATPPPARKTFRHDPSESADELW